MANPAPIVTVSGLVHGTVVREVAAVEHLPARTDEATGKRYPERPARDAYAVTDVTLLTDHGGFITVSLLPLAVEALGGDIASKGDAVTFLCRPYVTWNGPETRRYAGVGFSVAGEETAALRAQGKRPAAVPAAS